MSRTTDMILTGIAPVIWGSSYIVTTQFLPEMAPLNVALLRALPTGLILLLLVRQLPGRDWIGRVFLLGALNFSLFWAALFVAAYRLPGGVAATLGAVQPLFVLFLAHRLLAAPLRPAAVLSAISGIIGVGLLILGPTAQLDGIGIGAALCGALSMALGVVLSRRWQPPVSSMTFTAWQLTAGGLVLLPVAVFSAPGTMTLGGTEVLALAWLGLVGAGATYVLWFRGIARLGPSALTGMGFLSPLSAVLLGWLFLDQQLSALQMGGGVVVLASVWASNRVNREESAPDLRLQDA